MRKIFSILFWFFLGLLWSFSFLVCLLTFAVTIPFDRNTRILHYISCFFLFVCVYLNPFWRVRIEGRKKLPSHGGAILVSNHQSIADIPVLAGLYKPFKWVAKESLFRIPVFGWNMSLNRYVRLLRGDQRSIINMMRECKTWLERGVPVMIFPEGTRSLDGNLRDFSLGAFKLATRTGCPLYPIVLDGTGSTVPKHGKAIQHQCDITVRVLDPVDPEPFGKDANALMAYVHQRMKDELERLRKRTDQSQPS